MSPSYKGLVPLVLSQQIGVRIPVATPTGDKMCKCGHAENLHEKRCAGAVNWHLVEDLITNKQYRVNNHNTKTRSCNCKRFRT